MAITNAQQFKQLVNPPMEGKKRPGYRGDDAARSSEGTSGGRADPGAGAGFGDGPSRGISKGNTAREQGIMNQYQGPKGTTLGFNRGPTEIIGGKEFAINPPTRFEEEQKNFAISLENDRRRTEARKRALKERTFLEKLGMLGYTDRTLDDNLVDIGAIDRQFGTIGSVPTGFVGPAIGALTVDPATKSFDIDSIREIASTKTTTGGSLSAKDADTLGDIRGDIQMRDRILDPNDKVTQSEFDEYMNRNKIEDTTGGDGIQDPCKGPNPPAYCFVGIRSVEPEEEKIEETFTPNLRLMADGGRAGLAGGGMPYEGGIMDLESSRQMYGLGKLVKKVTRSVKKIAKSPIGKAAIGAALFKFGGGFAADGFFRKTILPKLYTGGKMTGLGKGLLYAGVPAAAAYFMTPEEEEEQKLSAGADIADPSYIMNNPGLFTNRRLAAEGGDIEKEPVAKKVMPLLDMDGKEKDYRETGGFVDMGRMEKADDVPARLSKNEFVFTADAVRNAGDGSVDKGAEVMYNMMKNLEAGGEVSEESQGLEGARKMFQTSQRLEEVL
jgi:hypothetical protein